MMRARYFRNLHQFFRPGDLRQKVKCVDHVRFNLQPLRRIKAPLGDRKKPNLVRIEVGTLHSHGIEERISSDLAQIAELSLLEYGGLVRFHDKPEVFVDFPLSLVEVLAQPGHLGKSVASVAFEKRLQLAPDDVRFDFLADIVEALVNQLELQRMKLL